MTNIRIETKSTHRELIPYVQALHSQLFNSEDTSKRFLTSDFHHLQSDAQIAVTKQGDLTKYRVDMEEGIQKTSRIVTVGIDGEIKGIYEQSVLFLEGVHVHKNVGIERRLGDLVEIITGARLFYDDRRKASVAENRFTIV